MSSLFAASEIGIRNVNTYEFKIFKSACFWSGSINAYARKYIVSMYTEKKKEEKVQTHAQISTYMHTNTYENTI